MLISYEKFIKKVEKAESVRVIGSFKIEYTEDIMNIINAVVLLEDLGTSVVLYPQYYTTKLISETSIFLGKSNNRVFYLLEVNDKDYEIAWIYGKYFTVATPDFVTVLEIEQLIKVGYILLEKCLKMVRKSFEKW